VVEDVIETHINIRTDIPDTDIAVISAAQKYGATLKRHLFASGSCAHTPLLNMEHASVARLHTDITV